MIDGPNDTGHRRLLQLPWWTVADQAELDMLVGELVTLAMSRREHPGWSAAVGEAVAAIEEWRDTRERRSRAVYLRRLVDGLDSQPA